MSMPWVKLWTEALDDPKLARLSSDLFRRFINLVLYAGEIDAEGYLVSGETALTIDEIAWRLRDDPGVVGDEMRALANAGLLELDGDTWLVTNWSERQGRSQSDKRRHWRYRKQIQRQGLREPVLTRANGRCEYCGVELDENWVVDHITPPHLGGSNGMDNLAASCVSCSTRKAGRDPGAAGLPWPSRETGARDNPVTKEDVTALSQPCHSLVSRGEKRRVDKSREDLSKKDAGASDGDSILPIEGEEPEPEERPTPRNLDEWLEAIQNPPPDSNRTAQLVRMHSELFPNHEPPSYGYAGQAARTVGGAGRLAQLMYTAVGARATGDIMRYCMGIAKGEKKRAANQRADATSASGSTSDPAELDLD